MPVELNTLETAAADGTFDAETWPDLLQALLDRLDEIVHKEFPIPRAPPSASDDSPNTTQDTLIVNAPQSNADEGSNTSAPNSQTTDKENAPPASSPPRSVPAPAGSQSNDSAQGPGNESPPFPDQIQHLYSNVREALTKNFPKRPPHTIQRLSELILRPRQHYRFLPSYLNALYRVLSVSSDSTLFPLPQAVLPGGGGILNGPTTNGDAAASALGSDESLGGALLTPIPWLRHGSGSNDGSAAGSPTGQTSELRSEGSEMVEGPNGTVGRIETVSVINGSSAATAPSDTSTAGADQGDPGSMSTEASLREAGGVTQGELLRQEQEAGVVPTVQRSAEMEEKEEEDKPHARGPEEMTMEDTGPTSRMGERVDLDKAVGRPSPEARRKEDDEASQAEQESQKQAAETKEDEKDVVTADADGNPVEGAKDEAMTDAPGEEEAS